MPTKYRTKLCRLMLRDQKNSRRIFSTNDCSSTNWSWMTLHDICNPTHSFTQSTICCVFLHRVVSSNWLIAVCSVQLLETLLVCGVNITTANLADLWSLDWSDQSLMSQTAPFLHLQQLISSMLEKDWCFGRQNKQRLWLNWSESWELPWPFSSKVVKVLQEGGLNANRKNDWQQQITTRNDLDPQSQLIQKVEHWLPKKPHLSRENIECMPTHATCVSFDRMLLVFLSKSHIVFGFALPCVLLGEASSVVRKQMQSCLD